MTPQVNKTGDWEYEAIQKRYHATHGLSLTTHQAKQVCDYERLRDTPSDRHHFSIWEEFDFELATFRSILTPVQFEAYKAVHQECVHINEQQLVEQDLAYAKQLEAGKGLLHYYGSRLLPDLLRQRTTVWQAFISERGKVEYLKAEYSKYLDDHKKFILVSHFRHSRTLQPQLLQLSLLNHRLSCLLPDYYCFRATMDAPTRAVADHLEATLQRYAPLLMEGLKETWQALEEFRKANTARHLGEGRGWHVTTENKKDSLLFLLLLDRERYGC